MVIVYRTVVLTLQVVHIPIFYPSAFCPQGTAICNRATRGQIGSLLPTSSPLCASYELCTICSTSWAQFCGLPACGFCATSSWCDCT